MARHWSFVVCDKRYLYPVAILILALGLWAAIAFRRPDLFNRAGNFIIAVGVWMSMRSTLREGINRHKDHADSSPIIPGTNQVNVGFFNKTAFAIGDAVLQVHGFVLVVVGSVVSSFGDFILTGFLPMMMACCGPNIAKPPEMAVVDSSPPLRRTVPISANEAQPDRKQTLDWERMRQCAVQVDQITKRGGVDGSVLGRENHYSAHYERCFMRVSYVNSEAKKNKNLPLMYYELFDAFEEKLVSVCTDSVVPGATSFCTVQDKEHFGDCGYCRSFIEQRMKE